MSVSSDRHVLDIVDVKKPCTVSWGGMQGEGAVRHCGQCRKNVYDLSAMSRADAEELITLSEGDLCVRFRRRADGTIVTGDCPPVRRRGRALRRLALVGATAAGVAGAAMTLTPPGPGCTGVTMGEPAFPEPMVMGAMVAPPMDPPGEVAPDEVEEPDVMVMGDLVYVPEDAPQPSE
ncbi:MAG: hypothetical protein AAF447_04645 [Myxococcota bacterium]